MNFRQAALILLPLYSLSLAKAALGSDDYVIQLTGNRAVHELRKEAPANSPTRSTDTATEFALSSWAPHDLVLPSYIGGTSSYSTSALPALSANYFFSSHPWGSWAHFSPLIGASFLAMTRTGSLQYAGVNTQISDPIYLLPIRLGGVLSPNALHWKRLNPYLGVSLLPTLAVAGRSALSDGLTRLGLPAELSLGTEISVPEFSSFMGLAGVPTALDLAMIGTVGALGPGSLSGFGLLLGLKIKTEKKGI